MSSGCDHPIPPVPAPSAGEPPGDYEHLGALVHAAGHLTITTRHGPVVCMDVATFERLQNRADHVTTVGSPASAATQVRLTSREIDVLRAVAAGHSTSDIAGQRGVATGTVAQHLVAIRRKYRVHSTAAAVIVAQTEGHI